MRLFVNIVFSDYFMEQLRPDHTQTDPDGLSSCASHSDIRLFNGGLQYEVIWTFFKAVYDVCGWFHS